MESRADRRACIASQLSRSPHPITIAKAAELGDFRDLCPEVAWDRADTSEMDTPQALPILCSNFLVWQHAARHRRAGDFVAVFEDDALVGPGVWAALEGLLAGPCQDYDFIQVDTYLNQGQSSPFGGPSGGERVCHRGAEGDAPPVYPLLGKGATMQVIRRSALPRIIGHVSSARKLKPIDKIFQGSPGGIRARAWQPGLVRQFGKIGTSDADRLASGCNASVAESVHRGTTVARRLAAAKRRARRP